MPPPLITCSATDCGKIIDRPTPYQLTRFHKGEQRFCSRRCRKRSQQLKAQEALEDAVCEGCRETFRPSIHQHYTKRQGDPIYCTLSCASRSKFTLPSNETTRDATLPPLTCLPLVQNGRVSLGFLCCGERRNGRQTRRHLVTDHHVPWSATDAILAAVRQSFHTAQEKTEEADVQETPEEPSFIQDVIRAAWRSVGYEPVTLSPQERKDASAAFDADVCARYKKEEIPWHLEISQMPQHDRKALRHEAFILLKFP